MTPILAGILLVLMCRASTASFTATVPAGITLPVDPSTPVKYSAILHNTGTDYDATTGIYTVPAGQGGIYSLSVSMMSGNILTAHLGLYRNNDRLVWLYTGNSYAMASQTINIQLTAGDQITVRMIFGTSLFSAYNTFSAVKVA